MSSPNSDVRAARRAQREAERAARAQRKADAARERALEAARAGGLFEGMSAMPRTETSEAVDTSGYTGSAGSAEDSGATGAAPAPAAARTPLDPARRRILVEENAAEVNGKFVVGSTKTAAGRRSVPYPAHLDPVVQSAVDADEAARMAELAGRS